MEYRVLQGSRLIFRMRFHADDELDDAAVKLLTPIAKRVFRRYHPRISLSNGDIETVWWKPQLPAQWSAWVKQG
jgi:hypothetical protein